MKSFYIGGVLVLLAVCARGDVVLSDSFDSYTNGPLTMVSAGKWQVTSAGTGALDVIAGRALLIGDVNREDVNAVLANGPYPPDSGAVLHAQFTIYCTNRPTGNGTYFAHLRGGANTHYCRVFATATGASSKTFRVGVANRSDAATAIVPVNLALKSNYTIVVRYVVSNATSTVWVNPTNASIGGLTATDAAPAITIASFGFRQASDMGVLFADNLLVTNMLPPAPPAILARPQSQFVGEGATVTFSVQAGGTAPFGYQWRHDGSDLPAATNADLTLTNVMVAQAGNYVVTISNVAGMTNSDPVQLTVMAAGGDGLLRVLTYNVHGFGVTDWSTNSAQVQAIGRQLAFLRPDIVTFNEIPYDGTGQVPGFTAAYLPGYYWATNSGSDAFHSIRSVILSRFPITRSTSWLDAADLSAFGYTNAHFTRDLFEAQISVPRFAWPLHVFTTHLKATDTSGQQDDADRRGAEASAISNFFVTVFLPNNPLHPYILTGDMNEDVLRPDTGSYTTAGPIQRLTSPSTGLCLTRPLNGFTMSDATWSIQNANPTKRLDYILPCCLLFSNVNSSQVFRTDKLNPPPALVNALDDKAASDHLPVLMEFKNPYVAPFAISDITVSNQNLSMRWAAVTGRLYAVLGSSNLSSWTLAATNLTVTDGSVTWSTNLQATRQFYRVYQQP